MKVKRTAALLIAIVMILCTVPGVYAQSANFTYDESSKTIYISGSGALTDGDPMAQYLKDAENIVVGKGITSVGKNVFAALENVKTVTFPEGLTSIGDRAFYLSSGVEKVVLPSTLKAIGERAFESCSSLKEVQLPKALEKIGIKAFSGCSSLESIYVDDNNPNFSSDDGVLYDKAGQVLIAYPGGKKEANVVIPQGVEEIANSAFSYNYIIESVALPDSLAKIEDAGFYFCKNLGSVTFGRGLKSIGSDSFYGCAMESVVLPYGTASIGERAFKNCRNLSYISIPSSVAQIDKDMHAGTSRNLKIGCFAGRALAYASENGVKTENAVTVILSGKGELFFDVPGRVDNGCTMVPMRKIFEELGAQVSWNNEERTAVGVFNGIEVSVKIGENVLYKNGVPVSLAAPAVIENGRTLVHVRAIAEAFGAQVDWDGDNGVVTITQN